MVINFPGLLSSSWREVLLKGLVADVHIVVSTGRLKRTVFELGAFERSRTQAQLVSLLGS